MAFIYNVTFDALDPPGLARFWSAVTGYPIAEERPDFVRLRSLGATLVDQADTWRVGNGTRWVVLRDPEGNEFCLG
jgi:hypothetical protein